MAHTDESPPAPGGRPRGPRSRAGSGAADDIAGAGRTTVGVDAALRARDVDRPTAADLARAEASLQLVRRHWTPPAG